jgi:3-oxoacyl-[acyl-carrier-protein] synthase-3
MAGLRSQVLGCGAYLPARIVTNEDLSRQIETSDDWIVQRTGIRQRHLAAEGEYTSDLAYHAAVSALAHARVAAADLDLLIVATATPDHTFPATATKVQARLGMNRGAAFDIQAVCSGFVFALATADNFLKSGQARTALVIGAETFSRILDWEDRQTCVLFGDGAGAVVLRAGHQEAGILSTHVHSDGTQYDLLYVDGGPSRTQSTGHLRMNGKEVFRHAVHRLSEVVEETLAGHSLTGKDIDWLIPHQANKRIIEAVGKRIGVPAERVVMTVDRHANTSAASIPLALDEAVQDGRIRRGDLILLEAMGGGLTWGSALLRW